MTREETSRVIAAIRIIWPHSDLGGNLGEVVSMWTSFLADYEYRHVDAAVREHVALGSDHAPKLPALIKTLSERTSVAPDWDEVREEVLRAVKGYRQPAGVQADPYAPPPDTYWSHPLIARFMDGAWKEWRESNESDGTFAAQQREAWKALAARTQRGVALAAVGAPRQTAGGLNRPDYLRALPTPDGAA